MIHVFLVLTPNHPPAREAGRLPRERSRRRGADGDAVATDIVAVDPSVIVPGETAGLMGAGPMDFGVAEVSHHDGPRDLPFDLSRLGHEFTSPSG
jgi:hypothetical protein